MNRFLIFLCLTLSSLPLAAQRRMVVCDVETSQPISSVSVQSSAGAEVTDTMGYFSVPDSCKSLILSHLNYESRLLNVNEVGDTVFLVSKDLGIRELVVFGKKSDDGLADRIKKMVALSKTDAQLLANDPANGGNLLAVIGKAIGKLISKKSKKARSKEKAREIIENY